MPFFKMLIAIVFVCTIVACTKRGGGNSPNHQKDMRTLSTETPSAELKEKETVRSNNDNMSVKMNPQIIENSFQSANQTPLSTFSIDVDKAAYSNVRNYINNNQLPPNEAIRIEEMINYFDYDYATPTNSDPFAVHTEVATCPWNVKHQLVHIGLKGKEMQSDKLIASNLVFLVDVSGSMEEPNKLPLVKEALKLLTTKMRPEDKIAIVTYAGNAGVALPTVTGAEKSKITNAIDKMEAGGSTAGGAGIEMAYQLAEKNFIKGGNNRVLLVTDGDFNVGVSSSADLEQLIAAKRKTNIFLSVIGFGTGNYKDDQMQVLADKGNGNHFYIDNLMEAKKVLINEFGGTLFTIAKDVKIQVEFNPKHVQAYRLIGYENRMLATEDFEDDKKDAGELGAGHTVTAMYEIIPVGVKDEFLPKEQNLKYQKTVATASNSNELLSIKLRYKTSEADKSQLLTHIVQNEVKPFESSSTNLKFSTAVAGYALLLRNSAYKQNLSFSNVKQWAKAALGLDRDGYRAEFISLVEKAEVLMKQENAGSKR